MKVKTKANFISQRVVDSKKDANVKYIYINFDDGQDILEVQADRLLEIPRFAECDVVFDVTSNKYGLKVALYDLKVIK